MTHPHRSAHALPPHHTHGNPRLVNTPKTAPTYNPYAMSVAQTAMSHRRPTYIPPRAVYDNITTITSHMGARGGINTSGAPSRGGCNCGR